MKSSILVAFASLSSIGLSRPQPALEGQLAQPPRAVETLVARDTREHGFNDPYGRWLLQRRDDTTTAEGATTSSTEDSTTAESTTTSETDAATTTSAATTTEATSSATSETTSTQTSIESTSTSTSSASTSSATETSQTSSTTSTTSTASTTTSTATATSTASAESEERNHKGKIAAIITFTLLGSIFIGICVFSRVRTAMRRKRKAEAEETKKLTESPSMFSMVALAGENGNGRPATGSERKFDRESIMFSNAHNGSRGDLGTHTPRGSTYYDPGMNLTANQGLSPGYARSGSAVDLSQGTGSAGQSPLHHSST